MFNQRTAAKTNQTKPKGLPSNPLKSPSVIRGYKNWKQGNSESNKITSRAKNVKEAKKFKKQNPKQIRWKRARRTDDNSLYMINKGYNRSKKLPMEVNTPQIMSKTTNNCFYQSRDKSKKLVKESNKTAIEEPYQTPRNPQRQKTPLKLRLSSSMTEQRHILSSRRPGGLLRNTFLARASHKRQGQIYKKRRNLGAGYLNKTGGLPKKVPNKAKKDPDISAYSSEIQSRLKAFFEMNRKGEVKNQLSVLEGIVRESSVGSKYSQRSFQSHSIDKAESAKKSVQRGKEGANKTPKLLRIQVNGSKTAGNGRNGLVGKSSFQGEDWGYRASRTRNGAALRSLDLTLNDSGLKTTGRGIKLFSRNARFLGRSLSKGRSETPNKPVLGDLDGVGDFGRRATFARMHKGKRKGWSLDGRGRVPMSAVKGVKGPGVLTSRLQSDKKGQFGRKELSLDPDLGLEMTPRFVRKKGRMRSRRDGVDEIRISEGSYNNSSPKNAKKGEKMVATPNQKNRPNEAIFRSNQYEGPPIIDLNTPQTKTTPKRSQIKKTFKIKWFSQKYPPIQNQLKIGPALGQGSYSVVREAFDIVLNLQVAVKIFKKINFLNKFSKSVVNNEIEALRRCEHPSIVKLHRVVETSKNIYLVLDYWGPKNLKTSLSDVNHSMGSNRGRDDVFRSKEDANHPTKGTNHSKTFPVTKTKHIMKELIQAVSYLHEVGIYHRDLKLSNIMLKDSKNGQISVCIVDFGLVTFRGFGMDFIKCGTLSYMAPELISCKPYHGWAVDIWALGIVFYWLLTGRGPYGSGKTQDEIKGCILRREIDFGAVGFVERGILKGMLRKKGQSRISLKRLLAMSYWGE